MMTDFCRIIYQQTCQQMPRVSHVLSVALTQSQCKRADGNALGVCRQGGKQESDEYAFRYCCNVATGLMRSMESWASHFVVSPIHSPVQKSRCGIVLRHIHSDGWMLLLMFQTTEHHSEPFLWVTYKHTGVLWWQHFFYSHMLHR